MRILVVDDSRTVRSFLRLHLTRSPDREVFFAENGKEAADWIAANGAPDVILMDINMPVMNGLAFLRGRASLGVPLSIPVIMVTTEGRADDVQRALQAGATGYVRKPFTADDLDAAIGQALGGKAS